MNDKISVCVPSTGQVSMPWAWAFRLLQSPVQSETHYIVGEQRAEARNHLVEQARRAKSTHLFFLDSDVLVPPHGLVQLYAI